MANNDDLRGQLQQQQQAVTERALMIQWLYRWFNLDDYAYHTYQLAVYESNQCFKDIICCPIFLVKTSIVFSWVIWLLFLGTAAKMIMQLLDWQGYSRLLQNQQSLFF